MLWGVSPRPERAPRSRAVFLRRRLGLLATVLGLLYVVVHAVAPGVVPDGGLPLPRAGDHRLFAHQLLVYGRHALTAEQVAALRAAAPGAVIPVYGGELALRSGRPDFPLVLVQAFTVDARSYAAAAGSSSLASQLSRGVVLSRTGAALRHASVGSTLRVSDGRTLTVSAVVDDHLVGGYELATTVHVLGAAAGERASYLVVADGGDAGRTEERLRAALPGTDLRVTTRTRNGFFSSADTVLTQAQVKQRFGEFDLAYAADGGLELDPEWKARWIENVRIPQLGLIACNRAVVPDLLAAMEEVTRRGLGSLVHTADFRRQGGCWNPRVVRFGAGQLSAHTWGIAVDINVGDNPLGAAPKQDPRLVDIMERHGFFWGGRWLRPDGAHFEYVGR